jgi:type I restriction-modification system DNA methylase subunit
MPLSLNEIRSRAQRFAKEWESVESERAEAQTFWNEFFDVFGIKRQRIAVFEKRVSTLPSHGKSGFGRIDVFWPGKLLAEHKSAGHDLDAAFRQATDYFHGLSDAELPRYVIVSDFKRFRLYDLIDNTESQFALSDLPKNIRSLGFIAGYQARAVKEEDPVNVEAAERMGKLHDALKAAGYGGHALELLLVRLLFCLFADDTTIFDPHIFHELIAQRTAEDGSDLGAWLAQLFQTLNIDKHLRQKTLDEQLNEFPYVNGKLFEEALPLAAFDAKMRKLLVDASALDWSRISPAIFGSMFQSVMDKAARRNLGAHYTSEKNILKLIGPLFLDDLKAELAKIGNHIGKLNDFHRKLATLRFLDPACGCGNFLVIAYRELRLLELEVLKRLHPEGESSRALWITEAVQVDVDQFYGIEIEEFPAQIAQVAMWLMDHQMNMLVSDAFGNYFARLPLKKSPTIANGNALRIDWSDVVPKERLNYILGNPPFMGHHLQTPEQKADMLAAIGDAKAAGVLDFVTAWYAKAAAMIAGTKIRVAYVSTNSITQGEQVGILWRALTRNRQLAINFAHRTFRWTNEARGKAAVYCVIIGFANHDSTRKTIFEYDTVDGEPQAIDAKQINAYLVDAPWVLLENQSDNPFGKPEMMYGSKPTDGGHFLFTDEEKKAFLAAEPGAKKFIKPFLGAHEYLHGEKRWVLWLVDAEPSEIKALPMVQARVQTVSKFRHASKAAATRGYPYPTLFRQVTQPTTDFVLIPGHTSENRHYIPFGFFSKHTIIGNSCFSLPGANLYHFGVISSIMHMAWVRYTCGRLKSDFRYSKDIVYNNFPWPDAPTDKQRAAIEAAAQAVLDARAAFPDSTLADLYDPVTMPPLLVKVHQALDRAVDTAYGKRNFKSDADRVAFLFERYQALTSLLPATARPRRRPNRSQIEDSQ